MVPFNGAHSANTSSPWYYSVPLAHLSVCFCSSHHLCLSPLCCICEIQTLNTNIWKWKHSGSTGLGQKFCERFTAGFRSQLCWREDVVLWFVFTLCQLTVTTVTSIAVLTCESEWFPLCWLDSYVKGILHAAHWPWWQSIRLPYEVMLYAIEIPYLEIYGPLSYCKWPSELFRHFSCVLIA